MSVFSVQVLVVKAEISGRERRVGGVREVLEEQEVSYWLPGKNNSSFLKILNEDLMMSLLMLSEHHFPCFLITPLQAFVEVCMKSNNKYEAKKYVSKVTPEQRVRAHLAVR